jgi:hypothetical protein
MMTIKPLLLMQGKTKEKEEVLAKHLKKEVNTNF